MSKVTWSDFRFWDKSFT
ncbi:hypothetical protein LINPERPRIM_LOCUS3865 [Linum perenne]